MTKGRYIMDASYPVMVGIDGSRTSVRAAVWAADEAVARDTALDLVHVVDPAVVDDLERGMEHAHEVVHAAWEAVARHVPAAKLESEILQGNPALELANAARRAALLCVGHKGAGDSAPAGRGATVGTLVGMAPCSLAVVRRRHLRPPTFHRWVVAVLDETAESRAVLRTALDEAVWRKAPVLALTTWSASLPSKGKSAKRSVPNLRARMDEYLADRDDEPVGVQLCVLPLPHDLATMLEQSAAVDQMFVVGAGRQGSIGQLTSRRARRALRGTSCSILIVRQEDADGSPPEPSSADAASVPDPSPEATST